MSLSLSLSCFMRKDRCPSYHFIEEFIISLKNLGHKIRGTTKGPKTLWFAQKHYDGTWELGVHLTSNHPFYNWHCQLRNDVPLAKIINENKNIKNQSFE